MDGNRGAKGSIKDRLISMLYRFRYNKKKLKEEDFTKQKKEKQKEYLYTLKSLDENEDINVLDSIDKKRLDDVKLDANFVVTDLDKDKIKHGHTITIVRRPKGIKLENIKVKSSDLDKEKINIKKEIKKTKEEITILSEIDTFIKKSKQTLEKMDNNIKKLKIDLKDPNQDMIKIEEKYKKLKEEISKLKLQFDTIKNKYDLSDFKILESVKLMESASNYKTLASLNEVEMMVNVCKKEFDSIKSITIVSDKGEKIAGRIDEIKEEQKITKIKFNRSKEEIKSMTSIEQIIKNELEEQTKIVDEMYSKATYIEKDLIRRFEYVEKRKILSSIFRITAGIFTTPFTGKNIFGRNKNN